MTELQWRRGQPTVKYDLALREWEKGGCVVAEDKLPTPAPFVYYHPELNEYRLDRYLIGFTELVHMCTGEWNLFENDPKANSGWRDLGQIIDFRTEGVSGDKPRRPGYWVVLNLGEVDIFPGSVSRKPIKVVSNG